MEKCCWPPVLPWLLARDCCVWGLPKQLQQLFSWVWGKRRGNVFLRCLVRGCLCHPRTSKVLQQRNLGSFWEGQTPFPEGLILGKLWEGSSCYKDVSCQHLISLALLSSTAGPPSCVNSVKTHCFFGSLLQLVPLIFKPLGLSHQFFSLAVSFSFGRWPLSQTLQLLFSSAGSRCDQAGPRLHGDTGKHFPRQDFSVARTWGWSTKVLFCWYHVSSSSLRAIRDLECSLLPSVYIAAFNTLSVLNKLL